MASRSAGLDADQGGFLHHGAEGGDPRRLTSDARMNTNPQWTPDGRGLVYATALDPDSSYPWTFLSHVDLDGKVTDIAQPGAFASCVREARAAG